MKNLSKEKTRDLFLYREGFLFWKKKISDKINIGNKAGTYSSVYAMVKIEGTNYYIHRLVWNYFNGPTDKEIDHINMDKKDNRIENLRTTDRSLNLRNKKSVGKNKNCNSKGVCFLKSRNKFKASISVDNKTIFLGHFDYEEDAAKAYDNFVVNNFGSEVFTNSKNKRSKDV